MAKVWRSRKLISLGLAPILIGLPGQADAANQSFDPTPWKDDFAQLKTELERNYANLAWMGAPDSGVDVPALHSRTISALETAQSDEDAREALRSFVAGFHDGHLAELPTLAPALPGNTQPEPAEPVLDPNDPVGGCAALGFASSANVAFSLPLETLPAAVLISDGASQPFRVIAITLRTGKKLGVIRIQNFRAAPFPGSCHRAWSKLVAGNQPIDAQAVRENATASWFELLNESIQRLKAKGVSALLIDVGNNSGGNDSGDWAARLLSSGPVQSAPLFVTQGRDGISYLDEQIAALDAANAAGTSPLEKQQLADAKAVLGKSKAVAGSQRCDMGWVWRESRAWNMGSCNALVPVGYASGPLRQRPVGTSLAVAKALYWPSAIEAHAASWAGPTYVLVDRRTYSSAEMFTAVMRDNGIAKIVGTRTGGDGCGFMAQATPVVLNHSRLRFRLPNCVRLRRDGTNEVRGIEPDIPLLPTEGESARARAMRLVTTIEADLDAASMKAAGR